MLGFVGVVKAELVVALCFIYFGLRLLEGMVNITSSKHNKDIFDNAINSNAFKFVKTGIVGVIGLLVIATVAMK